MNFKEYCKELEGFIETTYQVQPTLAEAETLAARFLDAQMKVAQELRIADLDARMRKAGLKAVRSRVYMEAATKGEKKPSDVLLENLVNMNELIVKQQFELDESEINAEELEKFYSVFKEAHIYYRGMAKGRFE